MWYSSSWRNQMKHEVNEELSRLLRKLFLGDNSPSEDPVKIKTALKLLGMVEELMLPDELSPEQMFDLSDTKGAQINLLSL